MVNILEQNKHLKLIAALFLQSKDRKNNKSHDPFLIKN